jgi:basic membrane protein A
MLRRMMVLSLALLLVGTLIVAACGPAPQPTATSAPEVKLRAAFVLFGTHDDGTWNAMAWEGMQRLKDMGYETAYTENVSDADAARVMRNYATEGYNLIWAHSGTYPNAVMEVAPDFPDVTFAAITGPGLEWPPNVWQVSHEWEDA